MRTILLALLKFLAVVGLLPILLSLILAFGQELTIIQKVSDFFLVGLLVFVLLHLFVFTPTNVFQAGQRITSEIFRAIPGVGGYLAPGFPFWTIVCLLGLYLCNHLFKSNLLDKYWIFFAGYFLGLHVVLSAQELRGSEAGCLKADYLLRLTVAWMVIVTLLALLLTLNFNNFSFIALFKRAVANAKLNYMYWIETLKGFK